MITNDEEILRELFDLAEKLKTQQKNLNTYEDRKISRYEQDGLFISTAMVIDDEIYPFETAIKHADYNKGELIIAEQYKTLEEAENGHKKWMKAFSSEPFPEYLIDCYAGFIGKSMLKLEIVDIDTRIYRKIKYKDKLCVGCGFCCWKVTCEFGKTNEETGYCKELYWNEDQKKYRCKLIEADAVIKDRLYVDEGCCMGLNSWRKEVKERDLKKV